MKKRVLSVSAGAGLLLLGAATLPAQHLPRDNDATYAVALGDVDGDGDLDLVVGNAINQQNRLYLNDGTGTFTDVTANRMPIVYGWTMALSLGDVDEDGDLDIVFANSGARNRLYLNDGTGDFSDATAARMPPQEENRTRAVTLGDVDGNGDLDLVFGNDGQQNRLYLNDGTGNFIEATANRLPPGGDHTLAVALGDVDGDGHLDLVFGNARQQTRLHLNDGIGIFTDATAGRVAPDKDTETRAVTLGDVDGDGHADLILGNRIQAQDPIHQQNRLYLNDGSGSFTVVNAARLPRHYDWTLAVALGDVDGDGDTDLIFANGGVSRVGEQNRLYLNDGTGSFTDATANRLPLAIDETAAVTLGDVDGDGDLDLIFGNDGTQNRLYLNDGSGNFTRRPRLP